MVEKRYYTGFKQTRDANWGHHGQAPNSGLTGSRSSRNTYLDLCYSIVSSTMVLCEDCECSVCFLPYSRMDRIPRVLHCRHTFCDPCLETMSRVRSGLLTVGCPLCRRVTCIGRGLSLQEALWVNSGLWDQIPEDVDREAEEDEEDEEEEDGFKHGDAGERMEAEQQRSLQAEGGSSRSSRTKLKLPAFFRKFSFMKQNQERIVPGSNVEMKSWRRLSAEETV